MLRGAFFFEVSDDGETITLQPETLNHGLSPFGIEEIVEGPFGKHEAFDPSSTFIHDILDIEAEEAPTGGGFKIKPRLPLEDRDSDRGWTISAWIQWPFKETGAPRALTSGKYGQVHIGITADSKALGVFTVEGADTTAVVLEDGFPPFTSSGADLDTLDAGWHFLIVTCRNQQQIFYVNGMKVGKTANAVSSPITCVGNARTLSGSYAMPFGTFSHFTVYDQAISDKSALELFRAEPKDH